METIPAGVDIANNSRRESIKQIISACSGKDISLINDNTLLALDLYIDSLIMTEIIYETEARFGIVIKDNDLDQIEKVADFYYLVESKI